MQIFSQYKGLSGKVYCLSLCRALVSMGMMFIFPYLTFILTDILKLNPTFAGVIMSICCVGSIIGNVIGGYFSDKRGKKITLIVSSLIVVFTMLASSFFCYSYILIAFILLFYIANNVVLPCISAMILDDTTGNSKTTCYSLMYLTGNLGCAIGPLIGGLLFNKHLRLLFVLMGFAYTIVVLLVSKLPESIKIKNYSTESSAHTHEKSTLGIIISQKKLLLFLIALMVLTLCYINLDFALPVLLNDLFGMKIGSQVNSLIWTINGIAVIVLTPFLTALMKRISPVKSSQFAALLYFVGFGLYTVVKTPFIFLLIVPLWTTGEIMLSTSSAVLISDSCPETHKGRAMALYEFARNVGRLAGPLIAGMLMLRFTPALIWFILALTCLLAAVFLKAASN